MIKAWRRVRKEITEKEGKLLLPIRFEEQRK
jgi:hypothetical protein